MFAILPNVSTWRIGQSGCNVPIVHRFSDVRDVLRFEIVSRVSRCFSLQHDGHGHVLSDAETANEIKRSSVVSAAESSQLVRGHQLQQKKITPS